MNWGGSASASACFARGAELAGGSRGFPKPTAAGRAFELCFFRLERSGFLASMLTLMAARRPHQAVSAQARLSTCAGLETHEVTGRDVLHETTNPSKPITIGDRERPLEKFGVLNSGVSINAGTKPRTTMKERVHLFSPQHQT